MVEVVVIPVMAFIISLLLGFFWLKIARKFNLYEKLWEGDISYATMFPHAKESYEKKKRTVTMGGAIILGGLIITSTIWVKNNLGISLLFVSIYLFTIIGFIDDYIKIKYNTETLKPNKIMKFLVTKDGINTKYRFVIHAFIASIIAFYIYFNPWFPNQITIPFTNTLLNLGWLYIPFIIALILGTVNAVNITDGLDGLAAGCVIITIIAITIISYMIGNINLAYFGLALIGTCLGFLFFNFHPAKMFMGEVGTSILGAALSIMVILTRQKLLFLIIGGVFVLEALSSIIQLFSIKFFKIRVFPIAPLHHIFQKYKWSEFKIVALFWFASVVFAFVGVLIFLGQNVRTE